jgi:exosome complex component MTR3
MQVTEEGRVACDVRFCAFARSSEHHHHQQRRITSTATATTARTRGRSARDAAADAEEREASAVVAHALGPAVRLETIPKSIVDLNVLVTEDDGAALAAACVACSAGLADAGIELRDLVAACAVAKIAGRVVVDPTAAEERAAEGGLLLALMPSLNEVT